MRWISLSMGLLLAGASVAWAFDEPKKKPPDKNKKAPAVKPAEETTPSEEKSVEEQMQAVQTELGEKQQKLVEEYQSAKDQATKQKIVADFNKLRTDAAAKYFEIVKKYPDDPAIFPALQMVISFGENTDKAIEVLVKHHLNNEQIGSLCLQLGMQNAPGSDKLARAVAEKSTSNNAKGLALLALGKSLFAQSNDDSVDGDRREKLRAEAEEALQSVVDDYADVKAFRGTAGDMASGVLFEVKHLAVGKEVPDLTGKDLEGTEFKISDYRGKVVFLDFWAHW
jgi:hypothetical protein